MQNSNTMKANTVKSKTGQANTKKFLKVILTVALILGLLIPLSKPAPVQAKAKERGYLWSLFFDFENNFDGVLTIRVGPWENGELISVDETSTATVHCKPVGSVALDAGDAVFKGAGYLQSAMDLGKIVLHNHNLVVNAVDNYGSMVLRTRVKSFANTVAPIFTHPNAAYNIDFTQTSSVTMNEELWNGAGLLQATFPGVTINNWQTFTYQYRCIANGGPCDAAFGAGGQVQNAPTAGSRVQFSTGPAIFEIGHGGGSFFTGRMDAVRIDPGNSAH